MQMAKKGKRSLNTAHSVVNTKKRPSKRKQFIFWLDYFKPGERDIIDHIAVLKDRKKFLPTIRDGIRLICDLRQGNLMVLFELFPWVRVQFFDDLMGSFSTQFEAIIAQHSVQQSHAIPASREFVALPTFEEVGDETTVLEKAGLADNFLNSF